MYLKIIVLFVSIVTSSGIWPFTGTQNPGNEVTSDECTKSCLHFEKNATFSCSNRTCTRYPDEIPDTVKVVILEVNHITEIDAINCNSLEVLDLSTNKIGSIKAGLFRSCTKLKHLDLSLNLINTLSNKSFEILTPPDISLQHLDLSDNKITILPNDVFHYNLRQSLEFLDLSNNLITRFPDSTFQDLYRLKKLILSSNEIDQIHPKQFNGKNHIYMNKQQHRPNPS